MIAQHADRAAAEPECFRRQRAGLQRQRRIDRRVEEAFDGTVRLRMAAQFAEFFEPPHIAEKHQKHRRRADPRHVGKQHRQPVAPAAVLEPDHRSLLKIGFRGGRKGGGEQQPDQRFGHRPVGVAPLGAAQ